MAAFIAAVVVYRRQLGKFSRWESWLNRRQGFRERFLMGDFPAHQQCPCFLDSLVFS